jgi:hypothetical protein
MPRLGVYLDVLSEIHGQNKMDSKRRPVEGDSYWPSLPTARAAPEPTAMLYSFVQSTSPRYLPDTRLLIERLDHAHMKVKYIIRGLPRPIPYGCQFSGKVSGEDF